VNIWEVTFWEKALGKFPLGKVPYILTHLMHNPSLSNISILLKVYFSYDIVALISEVGGWVGILLGYR